MKPIIMIGSGGHALSCLDVIRTIGQYKVIGYVDAAGAAGKKWEGLEFLGTDSEVSEIVKTCSDFFLGIRHIKTSSLRNKVVSQFREAGANFPIIISPKAHVAEGAKIMEGTIVMHGAHVGPGTEIGAFNILNTRSLVEHGVKTGSYVHVSTAAVVNGDVVVGPDSFIGSNSVLCHGIEIPAGAFVQAGTFIGRKHVW